MGVETTADVKIKNAKEHISEAYKELLGVLDEDTWGYHDLNEGYIDDIQSVVIELLKLKRKL